MTQQGSSEKFWKKFYGPNMGYVQEQYELYLEDKDSVDSSLKEMFDQYGAPKEFAKGQQKEVASGTGLSSEISAKHVTSAIKLVEAIRRYGHLKADIYPVGSGVSSDTTLVDPGYYNLDKTVLEAIPSEWVWDNNVTGVNNAQEVVDYLLAQYAGTISFEYDHVNNDKERIWFQENIESGKYRLPFNQDEKKQLLEQIIDVEGFENFLAKTFVAQKRFSIEGLEMMVPILEKIVQNSFYDETEEILMGMAHRGRLSVLTHILGKPYDKLFSEFHPSADKELVPSSPGSKAITYGWTGDVKYHFGAKRDVGKEKPSPTKITLAHNPSHLEFVNPVVEGFTRAAQDFRFQNGAPVQDVNKAFSILIHGDAAFIGEGVVAETFNLSDLEGYRTGGTLHIIANNLVGFTTGQLQGRSTRYASDLAKGFEVPIIHVNADDPEACISAATLAYDYRKKFQKDVLIDLVGYRRYGHNEMDEPRATQPKLYQSIDNHPTVAKVYANRLREDGIITDTTFEEMTEAVFNKLQGIYDEMTESVNENPEALPVPQALRNGLSDIETAVSKETLLSLNKGLLKRPEGFQPFKKLEKILTKRHQTFEKEEKADWAVAESLAFASILHDGIPIRMSGQDSERGTFAHRHLKLHDVETNDTYCPMHGLEEAKATFDIHNSPLSEAAVLGFEYGYSVKAPKTLVIWEAQFGDFANAGQVIFDQFISSGRAKWDERSNMVMLLPHGYEGQGPEHSSARVERFLTMAAENNWIVANVTTSAQLFHLLRRQAALVDSEASRPLVVFTPKSLLRSPKVASGMEEFTNGKFQTVIPQPGLALASKKAKRLLIGTGKVMVDIQDRMNENLEKYEDIHVVRLEQMYPLPEKRIQAVIDGCSQLEEIVWVQEEPRNMGAWNFVKELLFKMLEDTKLSLHYVGRTERSSPSVGDPHIHKAEQRRIVKRALDLSEGGVTNEGN
ncbi:2-oxoglutarate dehydrogenase E1 component [Gracilibacillus sp. S3-1-1]|uniref:2-oxoglutarate dehydrogenase E1 component n=1 Tax=Gracilibacillus pellucidus TaxID=3095368 RepID=A0ACC6M414_9BACI|nr:2-oxoglutarate dehydrogenase E1 component [Gracilibacillus sp. S3-1-1]MDX8045648.1 2-oxoglutarate dehydrogenase E1 component [Gracilibacillus sp. S3-1-1]